MATVTNIYVPKKFTGRVIGPRGWILNKIQTETKTKIRHFKENGYFEVKGDKDAQHKAKLQIKKIVSDPRIFKDHPIKVTFLDDSYLEEGSELKLLKVATHLNIGKECYKLFLTEESRESLSKEVCCLDPLHGPLLEKLKTLHTKKTDTAFDLWGHFGYSYIVDIDEEDENDIFTPQKIRSHLKFGIQPSPTATWSIAFQSGIAEQRVEQLCNDIQSGFPCSVKPIIRYDICFYTPTCHQLRIKLGSRLLLRSVPKAETPPPEMEEEQRIMVDYLSKALIVNEEGCVDLSCDYPLPDGFDQAYWRRSVRSTYPFNIGGESFKVMISKEEAWDHGKFENKADIHVHCNFWDEKLKEGDWEPEEIASKLPSFLSFVRDVQRNFSLGDEQDGAI
ncbi:uncharacterized protein LOC5511593 isoform X2 [Nematostella vectensis]|uniref:uncharacterized protein LOC5511593 isoform X2 n=1 Tax=Nematostella vectensis TaxID=45351 RepID=UPI002077806E|nr:uncharacterized protein LOC5511593 isoform X2 [Nematostella vectensis]